MYRYILLMMVVLGLLLTGCQKAEKNAPMPIQNPAPSAEPQSVPDTAIDGDIQDVGTLDKDLNMDDLDGIEKDLDSVDW